MADKPQADKPQANKFLPRPKQAAVLGYAGGKMGVSAVPGSGKTWILSKLAAQLVADGNLREDGRDDHHQEVLIVTLVNSAVNVFAQRVAEFVQERGLLPGVGYRVRTLHGLAHDIVRERPDLVGLSDEFTIIDERVAAEILRDASAAWLYANPYLADDYLAHDLEGAQAERVRRTSWADLVTTIGTVVVKQAKDLQIDPPRLRGILDSYPERLPLLEMGCAIYADYQRALSYRGAVDFDDLIRLALQALRLDPAFLARLRYRWPYILEDEAQDSSRLQELILRELSGPGGNWVRVGDPNQAIYETFTTASPKYLQAFLEEPDVLALDLPNSGRSTQSVMDLANTLIDWTMNKHPVPELQDALKPPYILATPPGDPQPNPQDNPRQIRFAPQGFSPAAEIQAVAAWAAAWIEKHPEETLAVLVPHNSRGFELGNALKAADVPYVEVLRSSPSTREAAGALANVIRYLAEPGSPKWLSVVYRVWRRGDRTDEAHNKEVQQIARLIERCQRVEDYIWPRVGRDWLETLEAEEFWSPEFEEHLTEFRALVRRWQGAVNLPIAQMVLTIAQDLFNEPADLAIAHKLAVVLRQAADTHPEWSLSDLTQELAVIARNERKFLGFADADVGLDPEQYRGKIVVTTMHKAKGLEWDKVYLMSVNDYSFPSALPQDRFISEPWYIRDRLNLEAETLAQLKALVETPHLFDYVEGLATVDARREYAAERLRLFYVGLTRARKALSVTWNTGRRGDAQPSVPFIALQTWWEQRTGDDLDATSS